MNLETLFQIISVVVYIVLAALALWGAFCVVLAWLRVKNVRMKDEQVLESFLAEVEPSLAAGKWSSASTRCESDRRAVPQLTLFAVVNRALPFGKLRSRLAERFQQDVMADLEHRLSWVATVIKSAPMIGLLGTVIGMMGAFANIKSGSSPDPVKMAEDIQFALITTACGLAIAVPLVLATAGINVAIRKMEDLVNIGLSRVLDAMSESSTADAPPAPREQKVPETVA